MQNLEVKDTILKIKKIKSKIKKNLDMQDKVNRCISNEDAIKFMQDFEQIIQNKKSDIVWLAYYQGQIFPKFRDKELFVSDMFSKFNVSKSAIVFQIALKKLIDDFPRIKDSWLSLHYF